MTEWLHTKGYDASSPFVIAWLLLDGGDDDPVRFLMYFIVALNQSQGEKAPFGEVVINLLQSPQSPPPETAQTSLVNEIAAFPEN